MSTKHTPGPWKVSDDIYNQDEFVVRGGESGFSVICGVWPHGDDARGIGEQSANARLIAAAPELLEAAKDALIVLKMHYSDKCGAANSLRAAIAKALIPTDVPAKGHVTGGGK